LSANLTPQIIGVVAIVTYLCLAFTPMIQSPIMRILTTDKERIIRMQPLRVVSQTEKILFPLVGLLLTVLLVPRALPLLGMLFFGNLLKESGVTRRLAETARGTILDIVTVLLGLAVGISLQAYIFLTWNTLLILILGVGAFKIATCTAILFVKVLNLFLKDGNKINPLIGNAGVSAMPNSARTSQAMGLEYDSTNYLLAYAKGASVAGLIGAAVAAGILLGFLG
jgi:oxaloacetate decarboxylase beta subunit